VRSGRQDRPGRARSAPQLALRLGVPEHGLPALSLPRFAVGLSFEAATDESPETRALLRSKLAGRNEVMDAMIASLDGHLAVPVPQAQAMYRALAAPGVYRELVEESGWSPEDFERWVGNTLQRNLMPQATPPPGTERPAPGWQTAVPHLAGTHPRPAIRQQGQPEISARPVTGPGQRRGRKHPPFCMASDA
jgi:hypothetical protein